MSTDTTLPTGVSGGQPPMGDASPTPPPPLSEQPGGDGGAPQSFHDAANEVMSGQQQAAPAQPYANPYAQVPADQQPATPPPQPTLPDPDPTPFTEPGQFRSPGATTQEGVEYVDDTEPGYAASAGRELRDRAAAAQQQQQPRGPDGRFQSGLVDKLTQAGVPLPENATDEEVGRGFLEYLGQQQAPQPQQRPGDAGAGADAARAEAAAEDARRSAEMSAYRQQQQAPQQEQRLDNWRDYLTSDESGNRVFRDGVDGATQARVREMARSEREIQEEFARDPRGTIDKHYGGMVEDRARQIAQETVQEQLGQFQVRNRAQNLVQQNENWLYEHDEYGGRKTDVNGHPQLSVAGTLVNRQIDSLATLGITEPDQQWDLAMRLGELEYRQNYDKYARDLAIQAQAAQQPNGQQAGAPVANYQGQAVPPNGMGTPGQQPQPQPQFTPSPADANQQHRQNFISQFAQGHVARQTAGDEAHAPNMNGVISRAADPNQPPVDPVESFRSMATELASQSGLMRGPR